ncbi:glycosyltransferase [Butyrivibrio sp. MC2021]|uniref:glycosyltransferase n=1 Tax=Butyrivibrio sp. MC2021 TaxID=1408306 RepID=UPI0004786A0D|nr:glycosyltransferase [Butyrivibrio sp. MC2021]
MDDRKFCFISCVNPEGNDRIADEICKLQVPEGYNVEYFGVSDVSSMCAGYNEAASISNAKYKIYMKQNIEFCNIFLLYDLLRIFNSSSKIGMVGTLGVDRMPVDMITEHGILYGPDSEKTILVDNEYKEVLAVAGNFIATQVDMPWDENNIDDWYFYALSQCALMRQKGYKVVVPGQKSGAWIKPVLSDDYDYLDEKTEKCRQYALTRYSALFNIPRDAKRYGIMSFTEISGVDFIWPLIYKKADFSVAELGISIYSDSDEDFERIIKFIKEQHLDVFVSFNFSPLVSRACEACGIKYVSWVFDCPQQALYDNLVKNDCNYIFCFDKKQVETTKENGGMHVFHHPLAYNENRMSVPKVDGNDRKRFSCSVSFVGNLYEDEVYQKIQDRLSENALSDYERVFHEAFGKWDGTDRLKAALKRETIEEMAAMDSPDVVNNLKMDIGDYYEGRILARALANCERIEMLKRLAKYGLKFYTGSKNVQIDGVTVSPRLDYSTELPKAYHLSKINIGTTLHTITSGIPLRVFDIMGAGGFLLTNFQPEIPELFVIGKEIEVYKDFDEMEEKVSFYLNNDNLREKIALNGYRAVVEKHNFNKEFVVMMNKAGLPL